MSVFFRVRGWVAVALALAVLSFGAASEPAVVAAASPQPLVPQAPVDPVVVTPAQWSAIEAPRGKLEDLSFPESRDTATGLGQLGGRVVADGAGGTALTPVLKASFAGLGDTGGVEPPDTQIAVGPSDIIEMVNNRFQVYSRSGATVQGGTLRSFFQVPATNERETDPRVQYDAASGRFFAVYVSFHNGTGGPGTVHVAASATNSAAANWNLYSFNLTYFTDYPGLGISDDKVAISYNAFALPGPGLASLGEQTQILEKADLVSGGSLRRSSTTLTSGQFSVRPASNLSAGSTLWMVDRLSTNEMRLWKITGTPAAGNATRTLAATFAIADQRAPNNAGIPGGVVDAGDQRLLDATWRDGLLWVAATTYCDWGPGDTNGPRACLHLLQVDTAGLSLTQDITYGQSGFELMWPAVTTDAAGNLYVVFTRSSENTQPEVRIASRKAADPVSALGNSVLLKVGETNYNGSRWGDYSSAVIDPADPATVWLAAEYSKNNGAGFLRWGTWIASSTYVGAVQVPAIASLLPATIIGGTQGLALTVNGSNFATGAVVRWNGSDRPTSWISAGQLVAAIGPSDIAAAGTAAVTVVNAPGAAPSNAVSFVTTAAAIVPAQVITSATRTGVFCFSYLGPVVPAAGFTTLFSASVVAVNRLNLPDGDFASWFRAAPGLASAKQVATGDILCVAAPPGAPVFAPGGAG